MAVAAATLFGLGAAFALGMFEGDDFGADGGYTGNCQQYAREQADDVSLHQTYIKGIVAVGFKDGPDAPGAIALVKTLTATGWVPLPFRDYAVVCVEPGREDEWAAKLKTLDWVEFAHKEGIDPFATLDDR
jgi:hypothetical protein